VHPKSQVWLLRLYGRLAKWINPSEIQATLLWAGLVGFIGGFSAILFRYALQGILWSWTGHTGSLEQVASELAWWQRFIIPAAGGLTAGLVLHFGARFGKGHRSNDYMEAVAVHRGLLDVRWSVPSNCLWVDDMQT